MFTIWGESFFIFCVLLLWGISLLAQHQENIFHHLRNFLVNICQHVAFGCKIRESKIKLNMCINISFKHLRYFIAIGKILIKINIYQPKMFYQVSILFQTSKQSQISQGWSFFINNSEEIMCEFTSKIITNSKYAISWFIVNFVQGLNQNMQFFQ